MKPWADAAMAAFKDGTAVGLGAVYIGSTPEAVAVWQGYGDIVLAGVTYTGIGDRGLIGQSTASVGASQTGLPLTLNGVDPAVLALFDETAYRLAPVIIWRTVWDKTGTQFLDAQVYMRGRLDQVVKQLAADRTGTIGATVQTAASGLGRPGGRMRSLTDQHLTDADDDSAKAISYASQLTFTWGGTKPVTPAFLPGTSPPVTPPGVPLSPFSG